MSNGGRTSSAEKRVPAQRPTLDEQELGEFAQELRRAIADRGVTLNWLHQALSVSGRPASMATLIGWRSGRLAPGTAGDLAAVVGLEDLLALPPGHLSTLVDVPEEVRGPGDAPADRPPGRPGTTTHLLSGPARARSALGFEQEGALVELSVSVVLELDQRGAARAVTQCTEWVARRDGADSFPVILIVPTPVAGRSRVEPLLGCALGPEYVDLSEGVFATTVVLGRPLRLGETARTEHRTHLPPDVSPEEHYEHRLLREVPAVEVAVRFHPDRVPSSCRPYTRLGDAHAPLVLGSEDSVTSQSLRRFGPGAVGFRWDW